MDKIAGLRKIDQEIIFHNQSPKSQAYNVENLGQINWSQIFY